MAVKRILAFALLAVLMISAAVIVFSVYRRSLNYSEEELLNMSETELYEVLIANGLEVPESFGDEGKTSRLVKASLPFVLDTINEDVYNVSSPEMIDFTDSMRKTVKKIIK